MSKPESTDKPEQQPKFLEIWDDQSQSMISIDHAEALLLAAKAAFGDDGWRRRLIAESGISASYIQAVLERRRPMSAGMREKLASLCKRHNAIVIEEANRRSLRLFDLWTVLRSPGQRS